MATIGKVMSAAVLALGFVLLSRCEPTQLRVVPGCPIRQLTGLYCPGCGTLRCLHSLTQGEFGRAWQYNRLTVVLIPVLAVLMLQEGLGVSRRFAVRPRYVYGLLLAIVVFGVLRNAPWFACLTPG